MSLARAVWTLTSLSFKRLAWSLNTLMLTFPIVGCCLLVIGMRHFRFGTPEKAYERFSHGFVLGLFATFVVPIIALAYATTSIGGDREDRTLLFLLMRPVPRSAILLAKFIATLPLVLGITFASYSVACLLAGETGRTVYGLYLPAIMSMALAYTALFHLFAVCFRHSTIVALVYALFVEAFVGAMPGIIKRVAINFYGRSMMLEAGGLKPRLPMFEPISAAVAEPALWAIAAGTLVLALLVFQWREYHDLT